MLGVVFLASCVFMTFGCFWIYKRPMLYRITYTLGIALAAVFVVVSCTW